MNFSDLIKQSNQLSEFSPDGQYLANASFVKLCVRDAATAELFKIFACIDQISSIEWSSDSLFILCGLYKRGVVQVWSIENPDWTCKIDEGSLGLIDVTWSPDSRHILTTSTFNLRITVWSLVNKSVSHIKYSKAGNPGLDFTHDGSYLAVAERRDCKDHISVFSCTNWCLVKNFKCDTKDLAGISWSPDGSLICAWDAPVENYKVILYFADGHRLGVYESHRLSALAVKCVSWSPSGQFIAVGSYDERVRILNSVAFTKVGEFKHNESLNSTSVIVYEEKLEEPSDSTLLLSKIGILPSNSKYDVLEDRPVTIPELSVDPKKPNPKHGIGITSFSCDNAYLLSITGNTADMCWIWDIRNLTLHAALRQMQPIKCAVWNPVYVRLALCTGNNKLYTWSPNNCTCIQVPNQASFQILSIRWHDNGNSLLLRGRENMCVCYLGSWIA